MDANAIKKLTFHNGKLTILEVPSNHTPLYPRVQVQFIESDLNFTVGFAKHGHLDLYWHSTGVPSENSNGVVGESNIILYSNSPSKFNIGTAAFLKLIKFCLFSPFSRSVFPS